MAEAEIEKSLPTEFDDEGTITATIEASKTMKGAYPYMSPELLQRENPSLPSDIWALGAIAYELLTGNLPFGRGGFKTIANIVSGKKPDKPKFKNGNVHFSSLNEALWQLILRCLEFDPAKRITADELIVELGKLCYSCSPRLIGTITDTSLGTNPNVGIILGSDMQRVFFHKKSYYGDIPKVGQRVLFTSYPGTPHPRAHPILQIK